MPAIALFFTEDYSFTDRFKAFYRERAQGGCGLMIMGPAVIDRIGSNPFMMGLCDDSFIPPLKEFVQELHEQTQTKVGIQLRHVGRYASSRITSIAWVDSVMPSHVITRVDNDSFIPGLKKVTGAVHEAAPDCRILLQLHHPGRQVFTSADADIAPAALPPAVKAYIQKHPEEMAPKLGHERLHEQEPVAPSAVLDLMFNRRPRAFTVAEIVELIDDYAEATRRAQEAGFDGVQIHAAHVWLISSSQ
jgi:2,4-dienoyl-CoA reductase-like NADH-dependent reductase (Old Yellow Enzyme family)